MRIGLAFRKSQREGQCRSQTRVEAGLLSDRRETACARPIWCATSAILATAERFAFNKLMALYPHIRPRRAANAFAKAMGFDNFFCRGPYPMFYSGLMVKGGLNPYAARFLRRTAEGLPAA